MDLRGHIEVEYASINPASSHAEARDCSGIRALEQHESVNPADWTRR
ncbi:MAG: hypothetical protein ABI866_11820 [Dokdonella sp.]